MIKNKSADKLSIREKRINKLKNYFPRFVPPTNRNKKIIKCSELIDWDSALFLFDVVIDKLLEKVDIPSDYENPDKAKDIFRDTIFSFFQIQYYQRLIVAWNEKHNKKDSLEQYRMIEYVQEFAQLEIKRIAEVIEFSMDYSVLKPIHFYEKLSLKKSEIQNELKTYNEFRIHKFDEENLDFYERVYMKIDENTRSDVDINYKDIVRRLVREDSKSASDETINSKYSSFMAFKNRHEIYNHQEFNKFRSTLDQ